MGAFWKCVLVKFVQNECVFTKVMLYMKNFVKDHFWSLNKVVSCWSLKSHPNRNLITTSEGTYVEALLYCVFERELCIPSWIEIHTMWAPLLLRLDLECMSETEKAFYLIGCEIKVRTLSEEHKFWIKSYLF